MQQYFVKGKASQEIEVTDKDTLKHMFQVMRLTEGDQLVLVFEDKKKRLAKVKDSQKHLLEVLEDLSEDVELPLEVTIVSGFPKGDKLDVITQKVTELGACALWAYPADWSVVKWDGKKLAKKADKLAKIALGAAEQSKRNLIPEIRLFEKKTDFLARLSEFDAIFVAYEESAKSGEQAALAQALTKVKKGMKILFVFGPEGGISPQEIESYEKAGALKVGLGPRIMRTETAPLYALSAISYVFELNR
ncbi:16S rRNA (uracil(1498)-N(3))-methyltransferase [Streptococcus catagoni]|uniref:16S rRNA (uracil(1498)-N(3))-methyltransferase n=1 Tax=Streptococcus catagoni TaxID=2654874 RepID=UPI00140D2A7E|nr:16S rRNA (uracil(1498)-N(3))-methyltransferase [Streptococcus catagoni]